MQRIIAHDNCVGLILLDVFILKLTGLELLKYICISYLKTDIIVVTVACKNIYFWMSTGCFESISKTCIFVIFIQNI
ncbi:hypothetical protein A9G30_07065 [Gilliamella sp. Fer4-1]|nr:hypothetical protein A9G30_07065 [Gilliamella apicola]